MDQQEIEDELQKLIASNVDRAEGEIDLDASVEEIANSLELSAIFYAVEKHFQVAFADSDIGRLRVFRDLANMVREARSA